MGRIITVTYMDPSSILLGPPCVCCWFPPPFAGHPPSPPSTGHREGTTGSRWLGSAQLSPPPPSLPATAIQIQPAARVGVAPSPSTPLPWSGDHLPEPGQPLRSLVVGS